MRPPVSLIIVILSHVSSLAAGARAFQSIPLVPHHVQERRRLEFQWDGTANLTSASSSFVERRSRLSVEGVRQLRAQQVGALYQGYGTHYIDLWCGSGNSSPPQRQTVIVDTGSAVTAFPCSGCRDSCGKDYHIDQVFDETLSSTFKPLGCDECMRGRCTVASGHPENNNCKIGMSYQEGSSWTAFEARDNCYVGGPHGIPLGLPGDGKVGGTSKKDIDKNGEPTADIDPMLASTHAFPLVFGCQTKLTDRKSVV